MTKEEVRSIFVLAGIKPELIKPLPNRYSFSPDDPRFYEEKPQPVWWFVRTKYGWIEIGWRKRVISINREDTALRSVITTDEVTKDVTSIHAWTVADAIKYLAAFREMSDAQLHVNKIEAGKAAVDLLRRMNKYPHIRECYGTEIHNILEKNGV